MKANDRKNLVNKVNNKIKTISSKSFNFVKQEIKVSISILILSYCLKYEKVTKVADITKTKLESEIVKIINVVKKPEYKNNKKIKITRIII